VWTVPEVRAERQHTSRCGCPGACRRRAPAVAAAALAQPPESKAGPRGRGPPRRAKDVAGGGLGNDQQQQRDQPEEGRRAGRTARARPGGACSHGFAPRIGGCCGTHRSDGRRRTPGAQVNVSASSRRGTAAPPGAVAHRQRPPSTRRLVRDGPGCYPSGVEGTVRCARIAVSASACRRVEGPGRARGGFPMARRRSTWLLLFALGAWGCGGGDTTPGEDDGGDEELLDGEDLLGERRGGGGRRGRRLAEGDEGERGRGEADGECAGPVGMQRSGRRLRRPDGRGFRPVERPRPLRRVQLRLRPARRRGRVHAGHVRHRRVLAGTRRPGRPGGRRVRSTPAWRWRRRSRPRTPSCTDGADNDCDGRTDADDSDCAECVPELCNAPGRTTATA